jgi:hypothetical protein
MNRYKIFAATCVDSLRTRFQTPYERNAPIDVINDTDRPENLVLGEMPTRFFSCMTTS